MTVRTADIILQFMDGYNAHFEKLADFLLEKQNRILRDDLKWLENALVEEQSMIMQGNSLEAKRLELFERLGLKDKKLSELIEEAPEERKGAMQLRKERLNDSVAKIKKVTAVSDDLVKRKMAVQEKMFGVNEFTGTGAYGEDARRSGSAGIGDIIGSV